jgi:hypothetical protein
MPTLILTTPSNPGAADWTDSSLVPTPPSGPAGGDLDGTYPNPTVVGLEGYPIEAPPPTNGDALLFNGLSNQWEHAPIIFGGGPPVGPAGGDLGGLYPNPGVTGLQSRPVANTAPAANEVLAWDGAQWEPAALSALLPGVPAIYGQFSDDTDQGLTALVPFVIQFDTTDGANGVSVVNDPLTLRPTRITVAASGIYEFTVSLQILHTGGGTVTIIFWPRIDGLDVPRSASSIEMGNNNNRTLPFVPFVTPMAAGSYLEWVIYTTGPNTSVEHFPEVIGPPYIPAIPSVIAGVKRLGA